MKPDSHRSYQDTPYPDFRKHVNIWADLERLRPKGDCVLVRMVPEPEMHANLIWIPDTVQKGENNLPRIGNVVAVGLGDRLFHWLCRYCYGRLSRGGPNAKMQSSTWHRPRACPECGGTNQSLESIERHPMHVKPGDRVLYWRVPANQHIINQEVFTFCREEQHIIAVIDKEGTDASTN